MSLEQKIIELDHRIIVLNNKLNELNQSLHVTDVDVNTLDERVSDLEDEVHRRTSISANRELQDKYEKAVKALRTVEVSCFYTYLNQATEEIQNRPFISFLKDVKALIQNELKELGEPLGC